MNSAALIVFSSLQTIFLFALGWFIKLLGKFSGDVKALESRVSELEKSQAVDCERWRKIEVWMEKIETKLDGVRK